MNRGSQDSQSQTSNGNTSSRRLFLQSAAVSAGATLALSPSPGLSQQAHEDRDVPAQDNEGILYREKDRDGELKTMW